jgi:hypothetical protein
LDTTKWKSVVISRQVYDELRKMAEVNDRSLSKQVAHLVRLALADYESSESGKKHTAA